MNSRDIQDQIQKTFYDNAKRDKKIRNAYLLVDSDKHDIHMNLAYGMTDSVAASPRQCNHMASVGKLFTATLIGMLHDLGLLDFDDPIAQYLDAELMAGIHIYKGKDYSDMITIRHLLMQSSGLADVFFDLLKKMMENDTFYISTIDAIRWGKKNAKPVAVPGKKHHYTDTNYYLLGLIIETVASKKFYDLMHEYIFDPLKMDHAYMHGYTLPKIKSDFPDAHLYYKGINLRSISNVHHIDHAGGSVIAPLDEFLSFIKALNQGRLVKAETLDRMINDDIPMGFPIMGFNYGYSIWKLKEIPILAPKQYYCWGCTGVTGAFMYFHPHTESYIIGSFNDFRYRGKALEFMARKVIKNLLALEG